MMVQLSDPKLNILSNGILIIGNGPSVQNFNLGNQIDKFENIARINNFKTIGFEELIGSKTTIWCNGANQNFLRTFRKFQTSISNSKKSLINLKV